MTIKKITNYLFSLIFFIFIPCSLADTTTLSQVKSNKKIIADAENRQKADDLIMNAMGLLGVAYKWGGTNPNKGMDCSGFIQYIFKHSMNINLPRTSVMMSKEGIPIAREKLQPGDLIFFATKKRRVVTHVGVYVGDGKFVHAPRAGKNIEIQSLSNKFWNKAYLWSRRVSK